MDKYFEGREKHLLVLSTLSTSLFVYLMYIATSEPMVITFEVLCYFFKSFVFTVVALPQKMFPSDVTGFISGVVGIGGQSADFVAPVAIGFSVSTFNGS